MRPRARNQYRIFSVRPARSLYHARAKYGILYPMEWIKPLLDWYEAFARDLPWRRSRDPYRILVSEVMLQQTRVNAVIGYYERFLTAFPTLSALANADEQNLLRLWEGLGYYSRARNLKRAAETACERFSGALPGDYDLLLSLPGVGEYTAGAVASIAFNLPVPAVDGNVLRVLARLYNDAADVADPAVKKRFRTKLFEIMPKDAPGKFNQALMELGALICVPNGPPRCDACPIREFCAALAAGTAEDLPKRSAKKPRRIEEKTVFALTMDGCPLVYPRREGVLKGLWQLPDAPGEFSREEIFAKLTEWGLSAAGEIALVRKKHVFTHIEWHMLVCQAEVSGNVPEGFSRFTGEGALPAAYRICLADGGK